MFEFTPKIVVHLVLLQRDYFEDNTRQYMLCCPNPPVPASDIRSEHVCAVVLIAWVADRRNEC